MRTFMLPAGCSKRTNEKQKMDRLSDLFHSLLEGRGRLVTGRQFSQGVNGMARNRKIIDAGIAESPGYEPDEQVRGEFEEAQRLANAGERFRRELREHHSTTPALSGGDVDAAWDRADVGEETVGGSTPTPDQDIVQELGEAVGLTYDDNEPLHTDDKIRERDRRRWELDPASSEDYNWRVNHEGE
jgi:hypothetical protein